mgnify:CR=1 FL=1
MSTAPLPPRLTTAEGAREIVEAGGSVHRDDRYTGDYRYLIDSYGPCAWCRQPLLKNAVGAWYHRLSQSDECNPGQLGTSQATPSATP